MRLNEEGLKNKQKWEEAGFCLPLFNRKEVLAETRANPFWIHFGAGNLFSAFQANAVQNLLNEGKLRKGLIVAEGFDYEIIEKINHAHDNYSILVTLKADGSIEKTVVGSVMESLTLDSKNKADFDRLKEIFCADSLQMASFTITEKGYSLTSPNGEPFPLVLEDFKNGPAHPASYIGKVTSLLYTRFQNGQKPLALVSMDNCSHNGDRLYEAVLAFARQWVENKAADAGFLDYVASKKKISFPCTMIDKITPRPDLSIEKILKKDGIEGMEPVVTAKNTYAAPFVNAEECEYLVIEDAFPNGREDLTACGFMFTSRETVDKVERMKVCTCLNPLHTALAVFGCLLGYTSIYKEMQDKDLRKLLEGIGYTEGLPVVVNPGVLDPKQFIDTVINIRFPNPFMPDTPQRIATDTSQKLAVRFGETIKAYTAPGMRGAEGLSYIPFVFAGWLRYLMGIDDEGNTFTLSPDPLLEDIRPFVKDIQLGGRADIKRIEPLLRNAKIFGVDLYEAGLAEKVENYFNEMCKGKHAVRKALRNL